jgi:hypothetical protein
MNRYQRSCKLNLPNDLDGLIQKYYSPEKIDMKLYAKASQKEKKTWYISMTKEVPFENRLGIKSHLRMHDMFTSLAGIISKNGWKYDLSNASEVINGVFRKTFVIVYNSYGQYIRNLLLYQPLTREEIKKLTGNTNS